MQGKFYTLFAMHAEDGKTDKHQVPRNDYTLNKKHSYMCLIFED